MVSNLEKKFIFILENPFSKILLGLLVAFVFALTPFRIDYLIIAVVYLIFIFLIIKI